MNGKGWYSARYHQEPNTAVSCLCTVPVRLAPGVLPLVSAGFLDHEAKAALGPMSGKMDEGVLAELYWKPGMTLVSKGEKTAIAALFACIV